MSNRITDGASTSITAYKQIRNSVKGSFFVLEFEIAVTHVVFATRPYNINAW